MLVSAPHHDAQLPSTFTPQSAEDAALLARETALWRAHAADFAWPTLLLGLATFAGFVGVFVAAVNGALAYPVAIAAQTLLLYVAFTPAHDASHGAIHGRHRALAWVDTLVGWLGATLFLVPFPAFRLIHLRHHAFTNDPERDPDHWVAGTRFAAVLARAATMTLAYAVEFCTRLPRELATMRGVLVQSAVGATAFAALVVTLVALGHGRDVLALWILPIVLANVVLGLTFDWLPHRPHESRERFTNTSVLLGPGLGVLMLGQNYHLVHHLYPRIPFYRLGRAFRGMEDMLRERGATIRRIRHTR